jgi:hypothetical protein
MGASKNNLDDAYRQYIEAIHSKTKEPIELRIDKLKRAKEIYINHKLNQKSILCSGWIARLEAKRNWSEAYKIGGEKERAKRDESIKYTQEAIKHFKNAHAYEQEKIDRTTLAKHLGVKFSHMNFYEAAKERFDEAIHLSERQPKDENSLIWSKASKAEVEAWMLANGYLYDENRIKDEIAKAIADKFKEAEQGFELAGDKKSQEECSAWKNLFLWFSDRSFDSLQYFNIFSESVSLPRLLQDGIYGRKLSKLNIREAGNTSSINILLKETKHASMLNAQRETFRLWHVQVKQFEFWLREQRQEMINKHQVARTQTTNLQEELFTRALLRAQSLDVLLPLLTNESKISIGPDLKWAIDLELAYKHIREKVASEKLQVNQLIMDEYKFEEQVYLKKDYVKRDLENEITKFKAEFTEWRKSNSC